MSFKQEGHIDHIFSTDGNCFLFGCTKWITDDSSGDNIAPIDAAKQRLDAMRTPVTQTSSQKDLVPRTQSLTDPPDERRDDTNESRISDKSHPT